MDAAKAWGAGMPASVGETKTPDRFQKEMYLHLYERAYHNVLRDFRRWLHRRLAVPAALFVVGLVLLLLCGAISRPAVLANSGPPTPATTIPEAS